MGFDEQVVRLDKEIADLANEFILVRILNMRGVNLNVFEFDYDLTWAALFMNAEDQTLGRFGGRDAGSAEKYLTLPGLKSAMRAALATHRRAAKDKTTSTAPKHLAAEQYPAASRLKENACIHCHQVYDFRREELRAAGKWTRDRTWVYPLPENIGLTLDPELGNLVRAVAAKSPADRSGFRAGDVLLSLDGRPVASFADAQYALDRAGVEGPIEVSWRRAGSSTSAELELAKGWKKTDISWRESMWGLEPPACVHGQDLTAQEKKQLGLSEKRLAFRQGKFVPRASRMAGIRENDIILGIDNKPLEMSMLQFNAYVRLNYQVGERITFNVIREGKRLDVPMTLPLRAQF